MESAPPLMLPTTLMGMLEQKHQLSLWTAKECHKQLLCLVETNLTSCGLLPDEARPARRRFDPDVRNQAGDTLLHAIVKYRSSLQDHRECIMAVLKNGGDPNRTDAHGLTPLMVAVEAGCQKSVRCFAFHFRTDLAVVDKNGHTALSHAVLAENKDLVSLIIDAAFRRERFLVFTIKNKDGFTAEQLAVNMGQKRVAKLLSSKRVKLLKTINRHLRHHSHRLLHKSVTTDAFVHTVFGIIVAHRWRSIVRSKLHRSHSFRHLGESSGSLPETPEANRKRSRSADYRVTAGSEESVAAQAVMPFANRRFRGIHTFALVKILNKLSVDDAKELLLDQSRQSISS